LIRYTQSLTILERGKKTPDMQTRLSSKGQVILPKEVRQTLGLQPGARLEVRIEAGAIILQPLKSDVIGNLYGVFPDDDFLTDLEAEHRQEIASDPPLRS
jgi:AbrB family looped-hinge helix DNA binding protein